MTKEQILRELLNIYKIQAIDLSIMYKIEFGDDVLAEINRLQNMLMEMEEQELWDQTLMDGLEDEPPYVSDDFQIGSDGARELIEPLGFDDYYWNSGEWKQPPVKIKHGDLVDIRHEDYPVPLIGRYIGKGYGVVELYHYSKETKHVVGKVYSRGLDRNPRLVSDEVLFQFIKD